MSAPHNEERTEAYAMAAKRKTENPPATAQQDLLGEGQKEAQPENKPESKAKEAQSENKPEPKAEGQPENRPEPRTSTGSDRLDPRAVFEAMRTQEARAQDLANREMTPEHLAKLARTRVKLAADRPDPADYERALKLNARDLGMKLDEYRELAKEMF